MDCCKTVEKSAPERLTKPVYRPYEHHIAQVAELVDALASGASDRKVVKVRVLSWAPFPKSMCVMRFMAHHHSF
jgi:hypothetical protein